MVGCCVYSREKLCWADLSSHSSFLLCKNHGYRRRFSPHQCIHIHILYVQKFFMEVYTTWSIICLVIHLSWLDVLTWAHRRSINIFSLLFASSFKQNRSTPPIYYIKSMRDYEQHVRRIWWWYSVRSLTGPRWHECEHWKCKNDVLRIWSWDTFYGFLTFSTFNSCMHQKYLRSMCGFGAIDNGRNAIFVWAFVAMRTHFVATFYSWLGVRRNLVRSNGRPKLLATIWKHLFEIRKFNLDLIVSLVAMFRVSSII